MSCSLTADAVIERRKTVTRRLGWKFLKPGDTLTLCRKVMGRKKGEPLDRLAEVEIVNVRRENLWNITDEDIARECVPVELFDEHYTDTGLPSVGAWVRWFAEEMDCAVDDLVTRIEWRYVELRDDQVSAPTNVPTVRCLSCGDWAEVRPDGRRPVSRGPFLRGE
jgi:hypothetical protein